MPENDGSLISYSISGTLIYRILPKFLIYFIYTLTKSGHNIKKIIYNTQVTYFTQGFIFQHGIDIKRKTVKYFSPGVVAHA